MSNLNTTVIIWSCKPRNGKLEKIKVVGIGMPCNVKSAPDVGWVEFERGPLTAHQIKKIGGFMKKHGFARHDMDHRFMVLLDKERASLRFIRYCR